MKREVEPIHGALEFVVNRGSFFDPSGFHTRSRPMNSVGIDLHKKTPTLHKSDRFASRCGAKAVEHAEQFLFHHAGSADGQCERAGWPGQTPGPLQ